MQYIKAVPFLEAIFNEGVYTWVLKIVTESQTDSLTNLIKCVVVYPAPTLTLSGQRHYGLLYKHIL